MRHLLILGGTADARAIAARLAADTSLRVTTSLAGRTKNPMTISGDVRTGGFGGADGLAQWIAQNQVDLLIDATHPFAARISANAREAAGRAAIPLLVFERPAWTRIAGDDWTDAATAAEAASMLGPDPKRVFLAVGRQEVEPFDAFRQHAYVVRSVEPIADGLLPGATRVLDRGPFDEAAERRLLEDHRIDVVVAKNSGGDATYGKIAAARALGLPVVMVRRPAPSLPGAFRDIEALVEAAHRALALPNERGE